MNVIARRCGQLISSSLRNYQRRILPATNGVLYNNKGFANQIATSIPMPQKEE